MRAGQNTKREIRSPLLPSEHTPLGIKAVVDGRYWGVLYRNELFGKVTIGRRSEDSSKQVREDGKLDLTLNQPGKAGTETAAQKIMTRLQKQGGFLPVGDKEFTGSDLSTLCHEQRNLQEGDWCSV